MQKDSLPNNKWSELIGNQWIKLNNIKPTPRQNKWKRINTSQFTIVAKDKNKPSVSLQLIITKTKTFSLSL